MARWCTTAGTHTRQRTMLAIVPPEGGGGDPFFPTLVRALSLTCSRVYLARPSPRSGVTMNTPSRLPPGGRNWSIGVTRMRKKRIYPATLQRPGRRGARTTTTQQYRKQG